jgi:hypothetical protein
MAPGKTRIWVLTYSIHAEADVRRVCDAASAVPRALTYSSRNLSRLAGVGEVIAPPNPRRPPLVSLAGCPSSLHSAAVALSQVVAGHAPARARDQARSAGTAGVQHGSTATHPDAGGLAGTREDDDLRGWTRVDVLPPDGMQEVSGSSPLSSTGQRPNSNESNSEYSRKVQQRRPGGPPYVCSDRLFLGLWAAGPTSASRC